MKDVWTGQHCGMKDVWTGQHCGMKDVGGRIDYI
jgi:hypothetical protein